MDMGQSRRRCTAMCSSRTASPTGVENKRKFLLVAQGATADTAYTINLDGVAVGSVTATKSGKLMVKSLDGDFRLAGTHLVTITDGTSNVIAQADFFPSID
jgi:hypothetical protein